MMMNDLTHLDLSSITGTPDRVLRGRMELEMLKMIVRGSKVKAEVRTSGVQAGEVTSNSCSDEFGAPYWRLTGL